MFLLLVAAFAFVGANADSNSTSAPPTSTSVPSFASFSSFADNNYVGPLNSLNEIDTDPNANIEFIDNATTVSHFMITPTSSNCKNLDFDWSISEVVGKIQVHGEFCSPAAESWSLSTNIKLKILGHSLINDHYNFSPRFSEVRKKINVLAAKIDVTFGVYNYCIRIVGNACYWAGKYKCADIYEQPYCFKKNILKASTFSGPVNHNDILAATFSSTPIVTDTCHARMQQIAELAQKV